MSFLDQLRPRFSPAVRQSGETCFAQGLVDIRTLNPRRIEATVKEKRKYTVGIDLQDRSRVEMSCTCPSFLDWGENCRHLWATLIEADQRWNLTDEWKGSKTEAQAPEADDLANDGLQESLELPKPTHGHELKSTCDAHDETFILSELKRRRDWRILLPGPDDASGAKHKRRSREASQQFFPFFILDRELSLQRGQAILKVEERFLKKNGAWGKSRSVRLDLGKAGAERYESAADQKAMELIQSLKSGREHLVYRYSYESLRDRAADEIPIPTTIAWDFLSILEATGRLYFRINEIDKTNCFQTRYREVKLNFAHVQPWRFNILFEENEEEDGYQLCPVLTLQDRSIPLTEPDIIFSGDPHWFIYQGEIHRIASRIPFIWIHELRKPGPIVVDRAEIPDFLRTLDQEGRHSLSDVFILPRELEFTKILGLVPRPQLSITFTRELWAHLDFRYGDDCLVDSRSSSAVISDFNRRVQVLRDLVREQECIRKLQSLGFKPLNHPDYEFSISRDASVKALQNLVEDEKWQVLGRDRKKIRLSSRFQFTVASGVDWFDLRGEVEFGDQTVSLQKILELQKHGERFIPLGDGALGILPEVWLNRNRFALELGKSQGKDSQGLRFSLGQAGLLDFLLNSGERVSFDEHYRKIRDCLNNFQGIRPVAAPKGFQGILRPYQKRGLEWLLFLNEFGFGGCLADDMGLGKTIQVLALLEHIRERGCQAPSLIVVPTSLVFNWQREARRFTPLLRVLAYTGSQRRSMVSDFGNYDLIITSYGILRRDILHLREFEFTYLILDEAQVIKNHQTQVAKASSVIRAKHRLSLTGTPLENHLGELWSQFEFLNPSLLGSYREFIDRFGSQAKIQTRRKDDAAGQEREELPGQAQSDLEPLRRLVHPFLLRRTKDDVEPELPDKTEQILYCDMTESQRALYARFRDRYRDTLLKTIDRAGLGSSRFKVLEGLLRLRQICCHPMILAGIQTVEKGCSSGKFIAFQEMLSEVIGGEHKALVFSQFTSMLRIMRRWLDQNSISYQYLDGRVRDRDQCIRRFQEDQDCKLFLISLKAGGFGLNLTAADYVFLYDPWWNPAVERQAVDRTHRIGQQKRVFTYRLITRDSVEEKIQDLQEQKKDLVKNVIHFHEGFIKHLTREDIVALFS
ncbi:MAG: SNF2-related protein [bacterium]